MIQKITVERNKCTCRCGHVWVSDDIPDRCAGCRSRAWNSDSDQTEHPASLPQKPASLKPPIPDPDPLDEFFSDEAIEANIPDPGHTVDIQRMLSAITSRIGKPSEIGKPNEIGKPAEKPSKLRHAANCTCFTCKPPKEKIGK